MKKPSRSWQAVANINSLLDDLRGRITERIDNPAPIRIAAAPTRLHEGAVPDRTRGGVGIGESPRPAAAHSNKSRNAFAVAQDHLRQFKSNKIQGGLEPGDILLPFRYQSRISRQTIGQDNGRVVRAHVPIDGDPIKT